MWLSQHLSNHIDRMVINMAKLASTAFSGTITTTSNLSLGSSFTTTNKASTKKSGTKKTDTNTGEWSLTVKTNTGANLMVRSSPSTSSKIVARLKQGTKVKATKYKNGWYYIPSKKGWASGTYLTGKGKVDSKKKGTVQNGFKSTIKTLPVSKEKNLSSISTINSAIQKELDKAAQLDKQINAYINANDNTKMSGENLLAKNLNGIYGIPYQFMSSVDRRIDGTTIGRTYADKIVSKMPLLLLSPGRVNFMKDYKDKAAAASALMKVIDSATPTELNDTVNNVGRYYAFDFDYVNYYGCVNQMVSSGSRFLELHDTIVNVTGKTQKLSAVNWAEAGNSGFKGALSQREYVAFYIDSTNQISETFSNTTTESQLAQLTNSASDMGREIAFLTGAMTGKVAKWWDDNMLEKTMETVDSTIDKYLNGNQLMKDITKQFATVAVGGKLLFPEIWQDSSFSKSYDINIKLRTPDGDKLSWFMNIYVPLCHLICLTAPIQSEHGVNGYVSPFLVRAFYKGMFNCDMGIVESLNISKGKEGAWTVDGLPTEVDVNMTLKDLYSAMSITKENNPGAFVNNLCLVDYIANTCGININEPDLIRQVDMYIILKANKYKHLIPNLWYTVQQDFANRMAATQYKISNTLLR